jgi:type IV pilus assembly protein PilP
MRREFMGKRAEGRGAEMHMKWMKVLFLALVLIVATAGCGEEQQLGAPTAADFVKEREVLAAREREAAKGRAEATAPAFSDPAAADDTGYAAADRDYFYDPRGKRDPFRSFQFVDDDRPESREFGPLEDFELGQLELSAVIWDANNPRALILDPGGRAFIVREGSQIGKNSGQVIHIGDNLVLVKETYENLAGERTTKDVELRIRLSQGG